MRSELFTPTEEKQNVQLEPARSVKVIFPDNKTHSTNSYGFKPFYVAPVADGASSDAPTLFIAFEDLYELGHFVSEMQKAYNLAVARELTALYETEAPSENTSDEVPSPEAN